MAPKQAAQAPAAPKAGAAGPSTATVVSQLPHHLQADMEIQQLVDLYQQQLAELNACHSLLVVDQGRLAQMLAPGGVAVTHAPDDNVILFRDGLALRVKEFAEDTKRLQNTEAKLQRKIDEASTDYEQSVHGIAMETDSRIYKRLREQQKLIDLQQSEIDQMKIERDLLAEETQRLRQMMSRDQAAAFAKSIGQSAGGLAYPSLHDSYQSRQQDAPIEGVTSSVAFAPYGYR